MYDYGMIGLSNKLYYEVEKHKDIKREFSLGELKKLVELAEEWEENENGAYGYTDTDNLMRLLLEEFKNVRELSEKKSGESQDEQV